MDTNIRQNRQPDFPPAPFSLHAVADVLLRRSIARCLSHIQNTPMMQRLPASSRRRQSLVLHAILEQENSPWSLSKCRASVATQSMLDLTWNSSSNSGLSPCTLRLRLPSWRGRYTELWLRRCRSIVNIQSHEDNCIFLSVMCKVAAPGCGVKLSQVIKSIKQRLRWQASDTAWRVYKYSFGIGPPSLREFRLPRSIRLSLNRYLTDNVIFDTESTVAGPGRPTVSQRDSYSVQARGRPSSNQSELLWYKFG